VRTPCQLKDGKRGVSGVSAAPIFFRKGLTSPLLEEKKVRSGGESRPGAVFKTRNHRRKNKQFRCCGGQAETKRVQATPSNQNGKNREEPKKKKFGKNEPRTVDTKNKITAPKNRRAPWGEGGFRVSSPSKKSPRGREKSPTTGSLLWWLRCGRAPLVAEVGKGGGNRGVFPRIKSLIGSL